MRRYRLSSMLVALMLAGCGGSSSGPTPSGKAVDGYLSGATVTCDANGNGAADTGENNTTTNSTGDFSLPCGAGLVLTGGTNIDTGLPFEGRLRAPSGSRVITPLTTLVSLGLSNAKLATMLGLPAGTDVTQVDPALRVGGVYVNQALFAKTLALQQAIQQTAQIVFSATQAGTPSAAVSQALYAQIAQTVATSLTSASGSTPLISVDGTTDSSVMLSIVAAAVAGVKSNTSPELAPLVSAAATLDESRVAAVATSGITSLVSTLAIATGDGLVAAAKRAQSETVLRSAFASLRESGALAAGSAVDVDAVAAAINTAVINGVIDNDTITALTNAGVSNLPTPTEVSNYFAIGNDTVTLGQSSPRSFTRGEFESGNGVHIDGPTSSTDDVFNIGFDLVTVGTPITAVVTAEVGFELAGVGTDQRIFRFIIDKVNLTLASGQVTASVPQDAVLTVYARKSDGVSDVQVSLTNLAANTLSSGANDSITFDASKVLTKALEQSNSQTSSFFSNLLESRGTFSLKAVLSSNVPLRSANKHQLPLSSVTIGGRSVGGPALVGKVTFN